MRDIVFNGKFYCGALNGVHRVADRLIGEVDRLVGAMPPEARPGVRLMLPRQRRWTPVLRHITLDEQAAGHTQFWEQVMLPRAAAGAVLVNLCNLAPVAHRRKIMLLHDAQFLFPDNGYPARRRLGHKLLTPVMARSSAQLLTVSQYSRAILDLTGISPRRRTRVIHNGADHILDAAPIPLILDRLGIKPRGYVLLFGSDKGYKNVQCLFEAFRRQELGGLRLVVIGQDAAAHRAAGLRPPANALFAGEVCDGQLRALYESALCLAFPSRTEGFGLPPLEAMLVGCPAVVAPAGAMPETCGDAASYADVDDPDQWIAAILRLARDEAYRRAKQEAGIARAAEFTWARAGAQLFAEALRLA